MTIVEEWKEVAADTFDSGQNKYNWATSPNNEGGSEVADISINGKYYVDIRTTEGKTWSPFFSNVETPSVFYLEVDVKRTKEEACYAGLVWGGDSNVSFRIDDVEKNYSLNVYDERTKSYYDLKGWTFSSTIRTGEVNRLGVLSDGKAYVLFINDEYINEGVINLPLKGEIGLQTSVCNENSQVTFEFDNFELKIPPSSMDFSLKINPSIALFDQGFRLIT